MIGSDYQGTKTTLQFTTLNVTGALSDPALKYIYIRNLSKEMSVTLTEYILQWYVAPCY